MCECIIILIILALAIFIPTSYLMGVVHGTRVKNTLSSTEGMVGDCQKKCICANPPDGLGVFCLKK